MAKLTTNLLLNGQQVTLSVESDGQTEPEFLDNFRDVVGYALGNGYEKPTAIASLPTGPSAKSGNQSAPVNPEGLNYYDAVMFEVSRNGDGCTIQFYGNDKKQPVNQFPFGAKVPNWNVDKVVEMFQKVSPQWQASHFQNGKKYNYPVRVAWKLGKTNSAGNQYKDVVALYAPDGADAEPVQAEAPAQPELPSTEPEDIPF